MPLPAETLIRHGHDLETQIQTHRQLIERAAPLPQDRSETQVSLWCWVAAERDEAWTDQLGLNVESGACKVFDLLPKRGHGSKLSGHSKMEVRLSDMLTWRGCHDRGNVAYVVQPQDRSPVRTRIIHSAVAPFISRQFS